MERLYDIYEYYMGNYYRGIIKSQEVQRTQIHRDVSRTEIIGDIHGDANIIGRLLELDFLKVDQVNPFLMYKLGDISSSHKCISLAEFSQLRTLEEKVGYQPIINFKVTNNAAKLIVLGDILDRGEHDGVILAMLLHLEQRFPQCGHCCWRSELYGLDTSRKCSMGIRPSNYAAEQHQYLACDSNYYQCVKQELNNAFKNELITLTHVSDELCIVVQCFLRNIFLSY